MKTWSNRILAIIILIGLALIPAEALKASKLFKYTSDQDYVFLTKFSVGEGHKAQFHFKAGFSKELAGDEVNKDYTLHYVIVTDDNWDEFLKEETSCRERLALAKNAKYVMFKGDGYWSAPEIMTFMNNARTTVYFVAAIN